MILTFDLIIIGIFCFICKFKFKFLLLSWIIRILIESNNLEELKKNIIINTLLIIILILILILITSIIDWYSPLKIEYE